MFDICDCRFELPEVTLEGLRAQVRRDRRLDRVLLRGAERALIAVLTRPTRSERIIGAMTSSYVGITRELQGR